LLGDQLSSQSSHPMADQARHAAETYFAVLNALREQDEKTIAPKGSQPAFGRQAMT
jgi:hypothetical protein